MSLSKATLDSLRIERGSQPTPPLLVQGVVLATVIGSVGGLLPALRAARLPIAASLREL